MKIIFSCILVLCIKITSAQALHTIDFKKITFNEALELSAKTGKPIFVDCYTSWCAPCKKMEQTVFVNDSVYKFYNEHFINFKIDMEKGEGVELKKKYEVASFPTYLFVDSRGRILHRTASLMPVNDFLNEGKRALNPTESYANIKAKYEAGDRSDVLLFNYAKALQKINRQEYQKIQSELLAKITDEELRSAFGWQVIQQMAMSETDRLGKYLLFQQHYFEEMVGKQDVQTVLNRLRMSMMYQLIREKKEADFFAKLGEMKNDPSPLTQRNVVMLEMEFYLESGNVSAFALASQNAMKGILEQNDADLSFIARRANYKAQGNPVILKDALLLARKAVSLNPEEYSNQGTLADICFELKLKEEGLVAARKARLLAKESTSKIEKIAQDKLDKMEALD